jgi:cytochrome P450
MPNDPPDHAAAAGTGNTAPPHVPSDLIVDLDFYDLPRPGDDVQLAWRRFLGKGPMVWSPHNGGHWVPTRADDIAALHRDVVRLSNRDGTALPVRGGMRLLPTEADPPEVEEYRRTVLSFFSPRQIDALEPSIRASARELIDAIALRGECEFVAAISHQLPIVVFLRIMALPLADRTYLLSQSEQIARNPDNDAKGRAMQALVGYIESRVTERRDGSGNDVISTMARARIGERPLRHDEIVSICTLLLMAGLDTVAASMGFIAAHLAAHRELRAQLRADIALIPAAVEEFLRRFAVTSLARVAVKEFDIGGVTVRAGDHVLLSSPLHNLDPERFPDPEKIRFDRGRAHHISFGRGTHACLGAYLARIELRVFIEEWLARIPEFEIVPGSSPRGRSGAVNALDALHLRWPV